MKTKPQQCVKNVILFEEDILLLLFALILLSKSVFSIIAAVNGKKTKAYSSSREADVNETAKKAKKINTGKTNLEKRRSFFMKSLNAAMHQ